jgi:uncharacterized protein (DUF983 family)
MSGTNKKPLYLWSVFSNKCPRCREGNIFVSKSAFVYKNGTKMHEHCPVCGQPTEIEVGFYYGTGFVSYAITVALSVATFVAWWVLFGFSLNDNSIFYWLGFNAVLLIVLQPPLMRFSRTLWLSWFVKYDPDWKEHQPKDYERVVKEQMNNW